MLNQSLECITPALVQRLVFARLHLRERLSASAYCKATPTQCLLNVGPASPVLASIHSALVNTSCWRYRHEALNRGWFNNGRPSVTLAHIQCGAKHDSVIEGGPKLAQHWVNSLCLLGRPATAQ